MHEKVVDTSKRYEWLYQIKVYDEISDSYPFWARINGYETQMTWKDRTPLPEEELQEEDHVNEDDYHHGDGDYRGYYREDYQKEADYREEEDDREENEYRKYIDDQKSQRYQYGD